jgi:hypothetical protein
MKAAPIERMSLCDICLGTAAVAGVLGMAAGIAMGMSEDFTLAPAGARLNLLAWVTAALMGLYYCGSAAAEWRIARVQVAQAVPAFWAMPLGLAFYPITGKPVARAAILAGSAGAFVAMLLFAGPVLADIRQKARAMRPPAAEPA